RSEISARLLEGPQPQAVVDHAVDEPHATGVENILEVREILAHVPETPLDVAEQVEFTCRLSSVLDHKRPNLGVLPFGHERAHRRYDVTVLGAELAVARPVAHLVGRSSRILGGPLFADDFTAREPEGFGDGLPGDAPNIAIRAIAQVEVAPGSIRRDAVEPEAQHPAALRGLVESVTRGIV